ITNYDVITAAGVCRERSKAQRRVIVSCQVLSEGARAVGRVAATSSITRERVNTSSDVVGPIVILERARSNRHVSAALGVGAERLDAIGGVGATAFVVAHRVNPGRGVLSPGAVTGKHARTDRRVLAA